MTISCTLKIGAVDRSPPSASIQKIQMYNTLRKQLDNPTLEWRFNENVPYQLGAYVSSKTGNVYNLFTSKAMPHRYTVKIYMDEIVDGNKTGKRKHVCFNKIGISRLKTIIRNYEN